MMIRGAQLDALNTRMLEKFSRDLCLTLESELPEWVAGASPESRLREITTIIAYGLKLRITQPEDLHRFAAVFVRFGLELPLPPALAAELRSPGVPRAAQIENLVLRLLSGRDHKQTISL